MQSKNYKKTSLISLVLGYLLSICFIVLILLHQKQDDERQIIAIQPESNQTILTQKVIPIYEKHFSEVDSIAVDRTPSKALVYRDHLIDKNIEEDYVLRNYNLEPKHYSHVERNKKHNNNISETLHDDIGVHSISNRSRNNNRKNIKSNQQDNVDFSLLDRRLSEVQEKDAKKQSIEINRSEQNNNFNNLVPVNKEQENDLSNIDLNFDSKNKAHGAKGSAGQLYAYNFPSKGVGAGVGTAGLGAAGGFAGLGAGIGQAMLNGEAVPALGGVGSSQSTPLEGEGVGGLVEGAGAGAAAGLMQGYIMDKLGLGAGPLGQGAGRGANYEHLPKNGALHIMMHVDGSGSILNTRKQLEVMKSTLLKKALLPYYNNDEDLYNRRVTIISNSGERTLRFFEEAAKKENVLAIAFQDEAQPVYHLPNFNKNPEDIYLDDLDKLKKSLNNFGGTYRGIMFQVDRGKTFAKSFKEFVNNSFRGEGYLEKDNLKNYHKDNNNDFIKNKNGIVFSDQYHAKDSGDPKYYLDLIFNASKEIGLDLNIYGAGLTDGQFNKTQ